MLWLSTLSPLESAYVRITIEVLMYDLSCRRINRRTSNNDDVFIDLICYSELIDHLFKQDHPFIDDIKSSQNKYELGRESFDKMIDLFKRDHPLLENIKSYWNKFLLDRESFDKMIDIINSGQFTTDPVPDPRCRDTDTNICQRFNNNQHFAMDILRDCRGSYAAPFNSAPLETVEEAYSICAGIVLYCVVVSELHQYAFCLKCPRPHMIIDDGGPWDCKGAGDAPIVIAESNKDTLFVNFNRKIGFIRKIFQNVQEQLRTHWSYDVVKLEEKYLRNYDEFDELIKFALGLPEEFNSKVYDTILKITSVYNLFECECQHFLSGHIYGY